MSLSLHLVFIFSSLMTFLYVIQKIRKHGLNIDDSIIWILWALLLMIISVFPGLPSWISGKLGFMASSNFIFSLFIFFLYIMLFLQAIQISKLKEKQKELIQKLSIKEYELNKEQEEK